MTSAAARIRHCALSGVEVEGGNCNEQPGVEETYAISGLEVI